MALGKSENAILAIDFGSTSCRAYVWASDSKTGFVVENDNRTRNPRHELCDFSTRGYPFEKSQPTYIGQRIDPTRESISLKDAFYILASAPPELLDQYRPISYLSDRVLDNELLRRRLHEGINGVLKALYEETSRLCCARKLKIQEICLSTPAQWDLEFENVYRRHVAQVFSQPLKDIVFVTEIEALAHYLINEHLDQLVSEQQLRSAQTHHITFIDFGGHNMDVHAPSGAGGGSEQWEFNIGQRCVKILENAHRQVLPPKQRQELLDAFNRAIDTFGPGTDEMFEFCGKDVNGNPVVLTLDAKDITRCFYEALDGPLKEADRAIKSLGESDVESPRVVVCGGSSRNGYLQEKIREYCTKYGIETSPLFADDLKLQYGSAKIAQGAAYAMRDHRTVEDFMNEGAAFGLQLCRHGWKTRNPWDDEAEFLANKTRSRIVSADFTGQYEAKIICDPTFGLTMNRLHYTNCYDVLNLGSPRQGEWKFELKIRGSGDDLRMILSRSHRSRRRSEFTNWDTREIPLFIGRGSICALIGRRSNNDATHFLAGMDEYPTRDPPTSHAMSQVAEPELGEAGERRIRPHSLLTQGEPEASISDFPSGPGQALVPLNPSTPTSLPEDVALTPPTDDAGMVSSPPLVQYGPDIALAADFFGDGIPSTPDGDLTNLDVKPDPGSPAHVQAPDVVPLMPVPSNQLNKEHDVVFGDGLSNFQDIHRAPRQKVLPLGCGVIRVGLGGTRGTRSQPY